MFVVDLFVISHVYKRRFINGKGVIMGGMETLTTNLLTNATGKTNYSGWQIVGQIAIFVGIGFITGKVFGGTKVGGITRGRNSFLSVWKGGLTRLRNGTGHIYGKVMLKGLVSIAAMRSMSGPISGAFSSAWDWIMWLFGDQTGIGYI